MEKRDESRSLTGWSSFKRALRYGVLICFSLLFVGYLCICFSIRHSVKEISTRATEEHPGDRVEALMTYVEAKSHSLRKRNRAVWALGQIGDSRAVGVLEKFRTGKPCDHSSQLCQRELEKAIKASKGSFNTAAWLPR